MYCTSEIYYTYNLPYDVSHSNTVSYIVSSTASNGASCSAKHPVPLSAETASVTRVPSHSPSADPCSVRPPSVSTPWFAVVARPAEPRSQLARASVALSPVEVKRV